MKNLFFLIKDRINFLLLLPILVLSSILAGIISVDLNHYIPNYAQGLPNILLQPKTTIALLLLWLATLTLYILYYYSSSKTPNLKNYTQINPPGFMKRKEDGYFCQPCLIKNHLEIELSTISKNLLMCRSCKEKYAIDYKVLLSSEYFSKKHDEGVMEIYLKNKKPNK